MTRTLILMRHAKSSWDDPTQDDHDRALNTRGIRSAEALGKWMRQHNWHPDQILCSSALRTRQTMETLHFDAVPTQIIGQLYHAGPAALMDALQGATGECVLMIGHNPGIAEFAARLLASPPDSDRFFNYPTGATLVAQFDVENWGDVCWGDGQVAEFVLPRSLLT